MPNNNQNAKRFSGTMGLLGIFVTAAFAATVLFQVQNAGQSLYTTVVTGAIALALLITVNASLLVSKHEDARREIEAAISEFDEFLLANHIIRGGGEGTGTSWGPSGPNAFAQEVDVTEIPSELDEFLLANHIIRGGGEGTGTAQAVDVTEIPRRRASAFAIVSGSCAAALAVGLSIYLAISRYDRPVILIISIAILAVLAFASVILGALAANERQRRLSLVRIQLAHFRDANGDRPVTSPLVRQFFRDQRDCLLEGGDQEDAAKYSDVLRLEQVSA